MGCSAQQVQTTSKLLAKSNKQEIDDDGCETFKAENGTCYLPTNMLLNNIIQSNPKEQMKLAIHPNEIMSKIGQMAIDYYNSTGNLIIKIVFYDEYQISEQQQWMKQVQNFINVYIRRRTQGKLYGIYKFEVIKDEITAYLCRNQNFYLGQNIFSYVPEQDKIVEIVSNQLISNYQKGEFFTEMLFDPLIVNQQQIHLLLKEMTKCLTKLSDLYPKSKLSSIRKLNSLQQFSFIILIFDITNVNKFISGTFKFLQPTTFNLPINQQIVQKYQYKTLFTQLLTNATFNDLSFYIIEQVCNYSQTITIPANLQITETLLALYSQILSIQYSDVMSNKILLPVKIVNRFVTEVCLDVINEDQKKRIEQLLEYIANQCGNQYQQVIIGLYKTGDINLNNMKAANTGLQLEPQHQDILNNEEETNEFVCQVVDMAIQEYLFSMNSLIEIDLKKYDQQLFKKFIMQIKTEIQKQLLGEDRIDCGITLDDECFLKIQKQQKVQEEQTHQESGERRRKKKKRVAKKEEEEQEDETKQNNDNNKILYAPPAANKKNRDNAKQTTLDDLFDNL